MGSMRAGLATVLLVQGLALADGNRTLSPARWPNPAQQVDGGEEAGRKRDEQIAIVLGLLRSERAPATRAELMLRLAELQTQKAQALSAREHAAWNERMDRWVDGGREGPEPALRHRKSDAYKRQALATIDTLLKQHPDQPRADEALYLSGHVASELGLHDVAAKRNAELVRRFPASALVADAYVALGDRFFDLRDVIKARRAFERAYRAGKPVVSDYARYRMAWCDYNLQQWEQAIEGFRAVVEKRAGSEQSARLANEALNDLALTFTHVQAVEMAYEYFTHSAPGRAFELMHRVAVLYVEQGQLEPAERTALLLLAQHPRHRDAPRLSATLLTVLQRQGRTRDLVRMIDTIADRHGSASSWHRAQEHDAAAPLAVLEDALRGIAAEAHAAHGKLKKPPDAAVALSAYRALLAAFPSAEDAHTHYLFAELLYDVGEWRDAARHYEEVGAGTKEVHRNAAWGLVLAREHVVSAEEGGTATQRRQPSVPLVDQGEDNHPESLTGAEGGLVAACDRFAHFAGDDAGSAERDEEQALAAFKAAAVFHRRHHFDESTRRFERIIAAWPSNPLARRAGEVLLDALAFRRRWVGLRAAALRLKANPALSSDAGFMRELDKFLDGATFNVAFDVQSAANALDEQGRTREARVWRNRAIEGYREYERELPSGKHLEKARINAMRAAEQNELLDVAIGFAERLAAMRLGTETSALVLWKTATLHERVADYRRAAEAYALFHERHRSAPQAPDALFNAAALRHALGDHEEALVLYGRYLAQHGGRADAEEAWWRSARILEERGDYRRAARWYAAFEATFPHAPTERVIESRYLNAVALTQDRKTRLDGLAQCGRVLGLARKLPSHARHAAPVQRAQAHCHFILLEDRLAEYKAFSLAGSPARVAMLLQRKAEALRRLQDEYAAVVAYGDGPWAVAALYRLAEAHHELAEVVRHSPVPASLTDEQKELYRAELEAQVYPVDARAVEALEKALDKAFALGIYTEWTWRAQELQRTYKPNEFPAAHRMPFRYSDGSPQPSPRPMGAGGGRPRPM